jgi:hypothetical protein
MLPVPVVPLQTGVPDWLALVVVVASVALAVLTLSLMLVRLRPATDEEQNTPVTVRDPMLLLSAVCVIALAAAAWLLR